MSFYQSVTRRKRSQLQLGIPTTYSLHRVRISIRHENPACTSCIRCRLLDIPGLRMLATVVFVLPCTYVHGWAVLSTASTNHELYCDCDMPQLGEQRLRADVRRLCVTTDCTVVARPNPSSS